METNKEMYTELVTKMRSQMNSFKKWQRKIMNEPESEEKYAKVELMGKVIDRTREIVNWWDGYEAKILRREKRKEELQRAQEKEKRKAYNRKKVEEAIEKNLREPVQEWNMSCRYYCQSGEERSCSCGMDMVFCGKRCAFASNVAGSSKVYDSPVTINHRREKTL